MLSKSLSYIFTIAKMVKQKQMISPEHVEILHNWKERGFVDLQFEFEELTEQYIGQLTKIAQNLSDNLYVEGHKGEKVRIYKETTVMANEEWTVTSKSLLLQSGENNYVEEVWQHLLQKYGSETVMPTSKVHVLSSYQSVLFCLDNVPVTYGKKTVERCDSRIADNTAKKMCNWA